MNYICLKISSMSHISSDIFSQIVMKKDEFLIILPLVHVLNIHITTVCLSICG